MTTTRPTPAHAHTRGPHRRAAKALRRRARAAVARSTAGDRWLAVLVGLVLLAAGALVALLSYGVFGTGRAARPLLDPVIVDALRAPPTCPAGSRSPPGCCSSSSGWPGRRARCAPSGGPTWCSRATRTPAIVVSSTAAAEAVSGQAAAIPGVVRARARTVGTDDAPAVRVTLWLAEDADVRAVLARLDDEVLATARASLGLGALPVAVRLELDPAPRRPGSPDAPVHSPLTARAQGWGRPATSAGREHGRARGTSTASRGRRRPALPGRAARRLHGRPVAAPAGRRARRERAGGCPPPEPLPEPPPELPEPQPQQATIPFFECTEDTLVTLPAPIPARPHDPGRTAASSPCRPTPTSPGSAPSRSACCG